MGSNIHLYSDQVLYNVRDVLWNVKKRGGKFSLHFIQAEARRLQGSWPADTLNIVAVILGKPMPYEGKASEKQMEIFVENARQQNIDLLYEISQLRAAKSEAKE